ncbi:MAG: MiaB/RimO family radical SAM methylthiotransferase [Candidatus Margulisbacteria bacterium]|nr:MiaB/RimO family radical SAM methylthiotransferase [Candidatus Margulisiibacteriota bacterium]
MNVADSARLKAVLESAGYQEIRESGFGDSDIRGLGEADLILVNTCVVRQNAEDRAAWFIQSLKGQKKQNPNLKIGLCGCMVPEPERNLKKQFPHVDFFIPPNSPDVLKQYLAQNTKSESRNPKQIRNSNLEIVSDLGFRASNFVTIMTGCDNYCSYCVVPYVRGRETSRPMDEILEEIKASRDQGGKEITLLGQNVNSYKPGFANLLIAIQQLVISHSSLVINFMTSHPKDMSDEIIATVAELPYVAKDFHLPLQSGDDEILKKMNRGYTIEYFLGRVAKIRSLMPEARISTDLMVGFPGETEVQFENSIKLLKTVSFTQVNMFAYSPRPQTAAAKMPGQLPEEVKQERLQKLIETNRLLLASS